MIATIRDASRNRARDEEWRMSHPVRPTASVWGSVDLIDPIVAHLLRPRHTDEETDGEEREAHEHETEIHAQNLPTLTVFLPANGRPE